MAAYNKFQSFVENLAEGIIDLDSHTLKAMLTNVAPVATNSVKADLTEISAGNGYTAGGLTLTASASAQSSGTYKLTIDDFVWTASGGSIGPFRYVVIYDDTPTSPADPLICWFDHGSSITLADTETFTADASAANGLLQIA